MCVNPTIVFGAGDYHVTSTRLVRSFLLGRVPIYTDGAVNVVDVRDVAEGHLLADERGAVGERYILGGRNFTFDRLFADLGRLSGVDAAGEARARRRRARPRACFGRPAGPARCRASEVRAASQWWTYRATKARRELGWRARPHEETLEATVAWHLEREHDRIARSRRSQQLQYRVAGAAVGAGGGGRRRSVMAGRRYPERRGHPLPLQGAHRPRLPLRPGRAQAARDGIEFEEVRVPFLKRDRPEVEELTGQRWVPVLVHGDEVIHDSHRILEYLDWLEREEAA